MEMYERKLKAYIKEHGIDCEHLSFQQSCHSVEDAALAANANKEDFVKNICMVTKEGKLILAIVKGEDRASTDRVSKFLAKEMPEASGSLERPRIATPEEILEKSGYPCGGTPSFGYNAIFLIDEKIFQKEIVYTGGGSPSSLVKISTKELQRANSGQVCRVRK